MAKAAKPQDHHPSIRQLHRCIEQHGSQASWRPGAAPDYVLWWHCGPQWSSEEVQSRKLTVHILGLHCCPESGEPMAGWRVQGLSLCLHKFPAVVHHPSDPTALRQHVNLSPLSPVTAIMSPVPPLSTVHTPLHLFPISPSRICSLYPPPPCHGAPVAPRVFRLAWAPGPQWCSKQLLLVFICASYHYPLCPYHSAFFH